MASIKVNGIPATLSDGTFTATGVPLVEGENTVTAMATDPAGNVGTASIQVALDTTTLPTITATVTPAPNAAGWNNTDVTVSFDCQDADSGIATCTDPVVVSTEAANQTITGTGTDQAGNTATTSVVVNLDKTAPSVAINSPTDGTTVNSSPITVTGTITEALSGVESVSCNDTGASLSGSSFTCDLDLTDGANAILVQASDVAGNTGSSSISVTLISG